MGLSTPARFTGCTAGAVTAALILSASPAPASGDFSGRAFVHGGGDIYVDDWTDEGYLSTSRHASSNATCLWQEVLWSYDLLAWDDIDGVFGDDTRAATVKWQKAYATDQPADGIVGKHPFGRAGYGLVDETGDNRPDRKGNKRVAGDNYLTCS
ncbi:peptidoglycan-binding domain-containing protein [Streptomyces sp. JB150]|uniref:peptidoglycan-binding domain-containing protein n=1 Tax=Streptomyces sp. JB150 TaxID=2714844 RepID=UPI001407EE2E|nr:peptidoglycan-binding domain-containing protein [Streptomyces sp. JB150]QIJ60643.1 peptidoglycan-binding protein [Streptomyces sp. JB150]